MCGTRENGESSRGDSFTRGLVCNCLLCNPLSLVSCIRGISSKSCTILESPIRLAVYSWPKCKIFMYHKSTQWMPKSRVFSIHHIVMLVTISILLTLMDSVLQSSFIWGKMSNERCRIDFERPGFEKWLSQDNQLTLSEIKYKPAIAITQTMPRGEGQSVGSYSSTSQLQPHDIRI